MSVLLDVSHLSAGRGGIFSYLHHLIPPLQAQAEQAEMDLRYFSLHFRGGGLPADSVVAGQPSVNLRFPVKLLNHAWVNFGLPNLSWCYPNVRLFHGTHFSLPVMSKAKLVLSVMDVIYLKHPEYYHASGKALNEYGYRQLLLPNAKRADHLIAISQYTKDELVDVTGIAPERVTVVHFGRQEHAPLPPEELSTRLQRMDLVANQYVYFPVGTLELRKNIPRTLKAYGRAMKAHKIPLVLSGVGDRDAFAAEVRDAGARWAFWETTRDRDALYQGARFVIYPSLCEGFGLPALEAMSYGKALITSNNSSLGEIAEGGGILVNPESEDELTERIAQLHDDDALRQRTAEEALAHAESFSWSKAAAQTLGVYDALLK